MKTIQNIFRNSVKTLLEEEKNFEKIKRAIDDLHFIYYEITGIKAFKEEANNTEDTFLNFGKAVSPLVAANCLLDVMRTKCFIQGIYHAIVDLRKKLNNRRLNILYPGSGPYASLIIPLCFLFEKNTFKCTIIDIHKESIDAVRKVIMKLGLSAYFDNIILDNAFNYRCYDFNRPHIIISEVLQRGLRSEPQVALAHHLIPQMDKEGVFIPKEIKLDLIHSKAKGEESFMGSVLVLNKQNVLSKLKECNQSDLKFDPLVIPMPLLYCENDKLEIQTQLEVYDGIFLKKNQSTLNIPIIATPLIGYDAKTRFKFEYKVSNKPEVKLSIM